MAVIYSDTFQSYMVGSSSPFGSLTQTGFFASTIIDTVGGIFGHTQCVNIPAISGLLYDGGVSYQGSVSVFLGCWPGSYGNDVIIFRSDTQELGRVHINADGTVSVSLAGTVIATSTLSLFKFAWNWLQINFAWTNVAGNVFITAEVGAEEESIVSGTLLTGIVVAGLTALGANKYELTSSYNLDWLTIEDQVPIGDDPNPGTPLARVCQETIEMAQLPNSAQMRASSDVIEQAQLPTSALLRMSQTTIELVYAPGVIPPPPPITNCAESLLSIVDDEIAVLNAFSTAPSVPLGPITNCLRSLLG